MPKLTLKGIRVNYGFTQSDIADRLGVSISTVSKWERGESFPNVPQIAKLEKLFNISYADINFLEHNTVKPYYEESEEK